jgi:uncharacterized protein
MRLLRSAAYRRMPWKNGGGETTEIAMSPANAALDAFDWRLSMAHVATPGPFSLFPGIDRSLAVLAGTGLNLEIDGRGAVRLDQQSPPFAFPADIQVDATLADGAIDDLNIMTRRGAWRHLMSRLSLAAPTRLPRLGDVLIVITRARGAEVNGARLAPGDSVIVDDAPALELTPDAAGAFYAIDLWRLA